MSKSLGNVIRIRDALKEYKPAELRFYFETAHYREPMTYSHTGLNAAKKRLSRLNDNLTSFLKAEPRQDSQTDKAMATLARHEAAFKRFMNDDFNTPGALTVLEEFARTLAKLGGKVDQQTKTMLEEAFQRMANVLGILEQVSTTTREAGAVLP